MDSAPEQRPDGEDGRRVDAPGTFHHIWLWEAEALVLTDTHGPDEHHRHVAVQVVVSLGGPTAMRADHGDWHRAPGTVVASDVPHAYDSGRQPTLGLWVDPASAVGRALADGYVADRSLAVLDDGVADEIAGAAPVPPDRPMPATEARTVFDRACAALLGRKPHREPLDPRVLEVLHELEGEVTLPPVADLAAVVGLSPSRLQHLVREQIGVPLSRWVLWRRTLVALDLMLQGATSTDAAFETGFADAPDLTRRFREFFGAPPTAAVQDPRTRFVISSRLTLPAA